MKSLKDDIFELKKEIVSLSNRFDNRLQALSAEMDADYQRRMNNLAVSYQALSALSNQIRIAQSGSLNTSEQVKTNQDNPSPTTDAAVFLKEKEKAIDTTPSTLTKSSNSVKLVRTHQAVTISESSGSIASTTSSNDTGIASSKIQFLSPLMTLSGIATAMMNNA